MTLKVSISGVRGTPESLTKEVCEDFARAFATYLNETTSSASRSIVIGADTRPNSEEIKAYIIYILSEFGINCIDAGITPTPTIGVYIREKKLAGGIMITASHNPLPWNGIKMMRGDGIFLNEEQATKLINNFKNKTFKKGSAKGKTSILGDGAENAITLHINKVLNVIDAAPIKSKKFKVVVDPVNGAGYAAVPKLLEKLGCEVIMLHADPKKAFERTAEPRPDALTKLCAKVKEIGADVGFALDPDADRLAMVDENGKALSEELSIVLATDYILGTAKNKNVVVNLSTTMAMDDIVKKHGGKLIRTKIGEVHVSEKMKELNSEIGGEGNGGVIFPKVGFNRDSLSGIALILAYLASSNKKLSELVEPIPVYHAIKDKVIVSSNEDAAKLIEKTKEIFKNEKQDLTEGVKIIFADGWLHVRASNTEPIVRIYGEGRDEGEIKGCLRKIKNQKRTQN